MWEKLTNALTGTSEVTPEVRGTTADPSASK
jgi:hypothetical protein